MSERRSSDGGAAHSQFQRIADCVEPHADGGATRDRLVARARDDRRRLDDRGARRGTVEIEPELADGHGRHEADDREHETELDQRQAGGRGG
jgi:hypothetical protein